jgi:elongator complex protein 3
MTDAYALACQAILDKVLQGEVSDAQELAKAKNWACRKFGLSRPPSNPELLAAAGAKKSAIVRLLRLKPIRSISGVSVITVMARPYPCPKPTPCIYCPGGPAVGTPQSYTGKEPASARALQAGYDPHSQVKQRIEQLRAIGHEVDKVELVIFGGTFLAQPLDYQEWFVRECLDAITGKKSANLEEAKTRAETARVRTIGITFETRPDWCKESHVDRMLHFGATRVELGVQTLYDDIYELVDRGHVVQDVVDATRIAKDAGFAIVYHMMPGLPGSSFEKDLAMFQRLFEDPSFRPDMLKIYPCLVMRGTKLYELWKAGKFQPMSDEQAVELIVKIKRMLPKWVRVQRIQRDIPVNLIEGGVKMGNLRSVVQMELARKGYRCRCIRCREVGHVMLRRGVQPELEDVKLLSEKYEASEGEEIFLSFEDVKRDILIGHLRFRIPSERAHRPEISGETALVRMLYVFGELVPVGREAKDGTWQHRGFGEGLLKEAERISAENYDVKRMAILSGIGTRPYYRRFGYELEGPYMVKELG